MIAVFGSVNMDLVVRTPRWPQSGETVTGHGFSTSAGGKGANQAVACARLGAATRMVGRVGADDFGRSLLDRLRAEGIDVAGVAVDAAHATGVASIVVDDNADNRIILTAGANGAIDKSDLVRLDGALDTCRLLLMQLEIPMAMVEAAARRAKERGVMVILDPAPAQSLPAALYPLADYLTPNETEAAALVGFPLGSPEAVAAAGRILLERGARCVIIKLGARGAYWANAAGSGYLPALTVAAIDTVGAGDAFNAGFAVALSEGRSLAEALNWGQVAGALCATKAGAQDAMPRRAELLAKLHGATQTAN